MNPSAILATVLLFALAASSPAVGGKPGKPAAAAKHPKKPAPSLTVKDLALREAKACDANHNGRIDGPEVSQLRMAQAKNPKSYLYLFDDNSNHTLDDAEIAKIKFGPAAMPKAKKK